MAVDLRCPNCEDNLGKDIENNKAAHCGNCDTMFYNSRGEGDVTEEEKKRIERDKRRY